MFMGACVFSILALIAAYFKYTLSNPTLSLISEIIFYFSLIIFIVCFATYMVNSMPPIPADNSKLPI